MKVIKNIFIAAAFSNAAAIQMDGNENAVKNQEPQTNSHYVQQELMEQLMTQIKKNGPLEDLLPLLTNSSFDINYDASWEFVYPEPFVQRSKAGHGFWNWLFEWNHLRRTLKIDPPLTLQTWSRGFQPKLPPFRHIFAHYVNKNGKFWVMGEISADKNVFRALEDYPEYKSFDVQVSNVNGQYHMIADGTTFIAPADLNAEKLEWKSEDESKIFNWTKIPSWDASIPAYTLERFRLRSKESMQSDRHAKHMIENSNFHGQLDATNLLHELLMNGCVSAAQSILMMNASNFKDKLDVNQKQAIIPTDSSSQHERHLLSLLWHHEKSGSHLFMHNAQVINFLLAASIPGHQENQYVVNWKGPLKVSLQEINNYVQQVEAHLQLLHIYPRFSDSKAFMRNAHAREGSYQTFYVEAMYHRGWMEEYRQPIVKMFELLTEYRQHLLSSEQPQPSALRTEANPTKQVLMEQLMAEIKKQGPLEDLLPVLSNVDFDIHYEASWEVNYQFPWGGNRLVSGHGFWNWLFEWDDKEFWCDLHQGGVPFPVGSSWYAHFIQFASSTLQKFIPWSKGQGGPWVEGFVVERYAKYIIENSNFHGQMDATNLMNQLILRRCQSAVQSVLMLDAGNFKDKPDVNEKQRYFPPAGFKRDLFQELRYFPPADSKRDPFDYHIFHVLWRRNRVPESHNDPFMQNAELINFMLAASIPGHEENKYAANWNGLLKISLEEINNYIQQVQDHLDVLDAAAAHFSKRSRLNPQMYAGVNDFYIFLVVTLGWTAEYRQPIVKMLELLKEYREHFLSSEHQQSSALESKNPVKEKLMQDLFTEIKNQGPLEHLLPVLSNPDFDINYQYDWKVTYQYLGGGTRTASGRGFWQWFFELEASKRHHLATAPPGLLAILGPFNKAIIRIERVAKYIIEHSNFHGQLDATNYMHDLVGRRCQSAVQSILMLDASNFKHKPDVNQKQSVMVTLDGEGLQERRDFKLFPFLWYRSPIASKGNHHDPFMQNTNLINFLLAASIPGHPENQYVVNWKGPLKVSLEEINDYIQQVEAHLQMIHETSAIVATTPPGAGFMAFMDLARIPGAMDYMPFIMQNFQPARAFEEYREPILKMLELLQEYRENLPSLEQEKQQSSAVEAE